MASELEICFLGRTPLETTIVSSGDDERLELV